MFVYTKIGESFHFSGKLFLALACAGFLGGCGGTSNLDAVRLPETTFKMESPSVPLEIPPDAPWQAEGDLKITEEGLHFTPERPGGGLSLSFDPPLNAAHYNVFKVRMKLSKGGKCRLSWGSNLSPLDPKGKKNPMIETSVFPGDAFQEYTFALGGDDSAAWAGLIDRLYFVPVNTRATIMLDAFRLLYETPDRPLRMTIGELTMEAFYGTQSPWSLRVPPGAVFETHLGMHKQSWQNSPWGTVRFVVTLDTGKGARIPLLDRKMSPGQTPRDREWTPVRIPLHEYAGKKVTLHLEIDPCAIPFGDYAFWGNPVVFSEAPAQEAIPVVLISCDTLRADRLSCYGYFRETSPNLDRWAREEAVLFEYAITPETYTLPAHISMLTGLYPKNHQVSPYTNLAENVVTLPQWLRQRGYITAGFVSHNWWLMPWRGFAQGFDLYNATTLPFRHIYNTGSLTAQWLDDHQAAKRFLFFHNYDIHSKLNAAGSEKYRLPYDPGDDEFRIFSYGLDANKAFKDTPKHTLSATDLLKAFNLGKISFTNEEHDLINALYDDCIRLVDHEIEELFARLRRQGLYDNALIIVTADHGEGLNERDYYGHNSVYEEECRVPLIVRFPKAEAAGTRYQPQVQLTDIFATVQHVLGAKHDVETDGQSLLALIRGEEEPRPAAYVQRRTLSAVRKNDRKLISEQKNLDIQWMYYHLATDPAEKNNLANDAPNVWEDMRQAHDTFYENRLEGWFLRFQAPKSNWTGQLQIQADEKIRPYLLDPKWDLTYPVPPEEDNSFQFDVDCASGPITIQIDMASSRGRLHTLFTSPRAFQTHIGEKTTPPGPSFEMLLDPMAQTWPADPPKSTTEGPTMSIWYRPPDAERTAAQQPDEDIQAQLEALGYLE